MVLCIDIGNTNAVLGLYDNDKLIKTLRVHDLKTLSFTEFIGEEKITKVMISCVNALVYDSVKETIKKETNIDPIFIKWNSNLGLKNLLTNPEELGADLLVGGFAATIKYGVPNIVIDMGTATTLFVVNKNKEMLGGVIAPGAILSFKELMKRASLLKNSEIMSPKSYIGHNTNEAISSGVMYGNTLMIDGFVRKIKKELNEDNVKVIITGGMANELYEFFEDKYIHDDNLLLDGLYEASKILNE